jgi:phospholipid/cholesterol/gamma-HCH transport system substrate-binding protein
MTESVSGLTEDAAVKYRGVDVGRVAKIRIRPDNPEIVVLTLQVEPGLPVKEDTRATLEFQGLTGLAFINLIGGSKESAMLREKPGDQFPVIESAPSLFARLDTGLTELIQSVTKVSAELTGKLDAIDQASLARTIGNLERVSGTLASHSDQLAEDTAHLIDNAARASDRFPALVDTLETLAVDWRTTGREVRELATTGRAEIQRTSGQVSGEVQVLSTDLRRLVSRLDRVVAELEMDPSTVLYGRPKDSPGPGE